MDHQALATLPFFYQLAAVPDHWSSSMTFLDFYLPSLQIFALGISVVATKKF